MAKIHEWRDKYRQWWKGKLVQSDNGIKRVSDVKVYGPPSFVYGSVELIFEDGTRQTIHTEAYKPRKSDVEVIHE